MVNTNKISAIIPSFNRYNLLIKCINSIYKQIISFDEIYVIDNGSNDETKINIKKKYPEIKLIVMDKNEGFAKACNIGIVNSRNNLVALINNDVILDKYWLKYMIDAVNSYKNYSGFTSKILKFNNSKIIESTGDIIEKGVIKHRIPNLLNVNNNSEEEVFLIPATATIYRKDFFINIGGFDERFISYFEDSDLALRGQLFGYKYLYVPKAIAWHKGKGSSDIIKNIIGFYELRNSNLVWIKNLPKRIFFQKKIINNIIRNNIIVIKKNISLRLLWNLMLIFLYFILNCYNLKRKRAEIQKNIKVSDKYILANLN